MLGYIRTLHRYQIPNRNELQRELVEICMCARSIQTQMCKSEKPCPGHSVPSGACSARRGGEDSRHHLRHSAMHRTDYNDDDMTAGNGINMRTNNEGQFMVVLNVTSSEMMDSLMGGSRVAVACNASLPAIGTLEAPVVPHGARILGATAADNVRREIIDQSPSLLPGVAQGVDFLFNNATMEVLRELAEISSHLEYPTAGEPLMLMLLLASGLSPTLLTIDEI